MFFYLMEIQGLLNMHNKEKINREHIVTEKLVRPTAQQQLRL
jgi:hypothetical protein